MSSSQSHVKSKLRVAQFGEVLTPKEQANKIHLPVKLWNKKKTTLIDLRHREEIYSLPYDSGDLFIKAFLRFKGWRENHAED